MTNKFLIVEDDPTQRHMLSLLIKNKLHIQTIEATNGIEALSHLKKDIKNEICLIISDLIMPKMDGLELLNITIQQYPNIPVIILTATKDIDKAIKAIKSGAHDFIRKPIDTAHFEISIKNALKISLLEKEITSLNRKEKGLLSFDDLVGFDKGLYSTVNIGRKAAKSDIPVLITGETGVGKEIFAKAIHGQSHRAGKPFIAINCGAIPPNLVESTLFGHEKGAFTGAISKYLGYFRQAQGGTIFLDEIGDLPLDTQVKLLRAIQEKEIQPVGSDKTISIDVRIISATNHNLEKNIINNLFREDLYFRLNVMQINIPPLRDRKEDIADLSHYFIKKFSISEKQILKDICPNAIKEITNWPWQGNVRELENTLYRAMIMSENNTIYINDLKSLKKQPTTKITCTSDNENISIFDINGNLKTIKEIEQEAMLLTLKHHNGNITKAALSLNIAKSTFYRKLKEQLL